MVEVCQKELFWGDEGGRYLSVLEYEEVCCLKATKLCTTSLENFFKKVTLPQFFKIIGVFVVVAVFD